MQEQLNNLPKDDKICPLSILNSIKLNNYISSSNLSISIGIGRSSLLYFWLNLSLIFFHTNLYIWKPYNDQRFTI